MRTTNHGNMLMCSSVDWLHLNHQFHLEPAHINFKFMTNTQNVSNLWKCLINLLFFVTQKWSCKNIFCCIWWPLAVSGEFFNDFIYIFRFSCRPQKRFIGDVKILYTVWNGKILWKSLNSSSDIKRSTLLNNLLIYWLFVRNSWWSGNYFDGNWYSFEKIPSSQFNGNFDKVSGTIFTENLLSKFLCTLIWIYDTLVRAWIFFKLQELKAETPQKRPKIYR